MNNLERAADRTQHVEVIEGRFYLDGEEIAEAQAKELLGDNFPAAPDAPSDAETDSEAPAGGDGPENVLGRLRAGYAAGQGERRKTIEIAPARYDGLAAEFKPINWELRRKLIRRANRQGESGYEADLRINAACMADACVSMLFRPAPGADYVQLHTLVEKYRGGEAIRFDSRLADILGMELIGGESEADICRLVFGDSGIFEAHYVMLNGWSLDAFDISDDEDEDEGGDRPT
jgi:hypothetical protein